MMKEQSFPRELRRSQTGFTLVELMVAVAIIGILASLAAQGYRGFIGRSRQTEAKLSLSQAYTALWTYHAENQTFSSCLSALGYAPEDSKRYYMTGFTDADAGQGLCGPINSRPCNSLSYNAAGNPITQCVIGSGSNYFPATVSTTGTLPDLLDLAGSGSVSRNAFTVGAVGFVFPLTASVGDLLIPTAHANASTYIPRGPALGLNRWSIDQTKSLTRLSDGAGEPERYDIRELLSPPEMTLPLPTD